MSGYHAFFSYSHRADARLAPVLKRALERLGTPWWQRTRVRVFVDDASLPASAALWPSLEAALARSQHLILLASPASASSPWVEREVRWWLQHRSPARLLIAVTAGSIHYDPVGRRFDPARTDCLPLALRDAYEDEPFWVDLRFATEPEHRTLRHSGFRSAALGLAAALRGVGKDDLERHDIREHRRAMLLAGVAAAVTVALGLATAIGWSVAQGNLLQAESRRLAAEALAQIDSGRGVEVATQKAALAWRLSATDDARRALTRIDELTSDVARVLGRHTTYPRLLAFSPDGQRLATAGEDGVVLQWSLNDGSRRGVPVGEAAGPAMAAGRQWLRHLRFSRDGSHLLLTGRQRTDDGRERMRVAVFRTADGEPLRIGDAWRAPIVKGASEDFDPEPCVALSPAGDHLAVAHRGTLVLVGAKNGEASPWTLPPRLWVVALGFADDRHLHVVAQHMDGGSARALRLDLQTRQLAIGRALAVGGLSSCGDFTGLSDDGWRAVALGGLGPGDSDQVLPFAIGQNLELTLLPMPHPRPRMIERTGHHAPVFDGAGRRLAYGIGGRAAVWDFEAQRVVKALPNLGAGHGPPLALSAQGDRVASIDRQVPLVWTLAKPGDEARRIEGSSCGRSGVPDDCIRRLCERLTDKIDVARARELLGSNHAALWLALRGSPCASAGEAVRWEVHQR